MCASQRWLDPARTPSAHPATRSLPLSGNGERIGSAKAEKPTRVHVRRVVRSEETKGKTNRKPPTRRKGNHSRGPPPAGGQCPASLRAMTAWERPLPPRPVLLLSVTLCGMEHLLGHSLWVSYPGGVPLAHPLPTPWQAEGETQRAWVLCWHGSARSNALVCCPHWLGHPSTARHQTTC